MIINEGSQNVPSRPAFWNNSKRYYDLKSYWRNRFGCKVYKLPIDAGFTCPNRDGHIAVGGCAYCDGRGSKLRQAGSLPSITAQIEKGKAYYTVHRRAGKFIAYFQNFTNTYLPPERFRDYLAAACQPDIVALAVATRPDCLNETYLDIMADVKERYGVDILVELGLQTVNYKTLAKINRGHKIGRAHV